MQHIVHYQPRDINVVDYNIYFRSNSRMGFRGPRVPDHLGLPFGVALGSAGVFGRFVQQPFAEQLTFAGLPTVNLGISGARPQTFKSVGGLEDLLRRASFTIVEFMSGRGYPAEFFAPVSEMSNLGKYMPPVDSQEEPAPAFVDVAWNKALREFPESVIEKAVAEGRSRYLAGMKELIDLVQGKLVLLWVSQRPPAYEVVYRDMLRASGGFPHFVNQDIVSEILAYARAKRGLIVEYVEHVSNSGLPMTLRNRFTGKPEPVLSKEPQGAINTYYPSQAMHDEVAVKLLAALRGIGQGGRQQSLSHQAG